MIFEAAAFVDDHHIERPAMPVIIHQPMHILAVDKINIRRLSQRCGTLPYSAEDVYQPETGEVGPLCSFFVPSGFCYLLRSDNKHLPHRPIFVLQPLDCRQCDSRFAEAHIQEQPQCRIADDPINAILLIAMRAKFLHSSVPPCTVQARLRSSQDH